MKKIETHYIDGQFVVSHGREEMDSINPSNREVIGRVTLGDAEDANKAIAAAKRALVSFSRTTKEERIAILNRLYEAVSPAVEAMTQIMMEEYGAPRAFAEASCRRAPASFRNAAQALAEVKLERTIGKAKVRLEPVGVAGMITPWNASSSFVCSKLASAIAAGCTAVIKPSEMSALQTQVLLEALHQAKLPPGVFNVVNGRGDVVGAAITASPDVAKISFTGSTLVGKTIAREAVATMKRVTLELGGKSPNILLDDADLDVAIPNALAACFMNSGQACIAGTRLLVPKAKLDEVKRAILVAIENVKVGPPTSATSTIGPMVSAKQYERVQGYIKKGIEEGARLLTGGEGHPKGLENGHFVKPTVFVEVKPEMTIAKEEIFGPVLSVLTYDDEEQAIAMANDTTYGLAAYVSSSDHARAERVAARLDAGRVTINALSDEPMAPFGGFKQSGIGREFGTYGIEAYLEPKTIVG
jgi:aldehyde dehydrogenase (NAD+)